MPFVPKPPLHEYAPALLDWVADQPCLVCATRRTGIIVSMGSDPHHVTGRADGDVDNVVPLCRAHHREGHDHGWPTFCRTYRIDLAAWAIAITAQWRADQAVLDQLPFREETRHGPHRKTPLRRPRSR